MECGQSGRVAITAILAARVWEWIVKWVSPSSFPMTYEITLFQAVKRFTQCFQSVENAWSTVLTHHCTSLKGVNQNAGS